MSGSPEDKAVYRLYRKTYGWTRPVGEVDLDEVSPTPRDRARIAYYLGNNSRPLSVRLSAEPGSRGPFSPTITGKDIQTWYRQQVIGEGYTVPLLNLFRLLPEAYRRKPFLYVWGDHSSIHPQAGILAKTRVIGDASASLLKLRPVRHFGLLQDKALKNRIPFREKLNRVCWRGTTSGLRRDAGNRHALVSRYWEKKKRFDVGYSRASPIVERYPHLKAFIKGKLSLNEQLRNKFLISLEGNDVSSGLKWMLASNSVVLMCKPTVESWLMEGRLRPFEHFIPIKPDFSDLEEQVDWALANERKCLEIAKCANAYMEPFKDPVRETFLEREVLRAHLDHVAIQPV
ncbi:MAG: glycosyl transferase family 90 [Opitutales bacterium]